jgi:hypothetical protein
LLWYEFFSGTLKEMGFVLNPYDPCVANKMIEGKQYTVVWYVDDNKVSHVSPKVVDKVLAQIERKFGKMTTTRGTTHSFLGMTINFRKDKTVNIGMKEYIKEAIAEFNGDITKSAATPARSDLFLCNDDSPKLDKQSSENFHSTVAKLLCVSKRARLDVLLAISFLCTRVSVSTEHDKAKLRRVLEYLRGTLDLSLTLGARSG